VLAATDRAPGDAWGTPVIGVSAVAAESDPNFQIIIRILVERGATLEEIRAAIDAYTGHLNSDPTQSTGADTHQITRTPNPCQESAGCVSLGANMTKPNKIRELRGNGCLRIYSGAWYVMYRRYVWVDGKGRKARQKKDWLGRVDEISREQAKRLMKEKMMKIRSCTEPVDEITVRQFYHRHFLPEHIDKLAKASREQLMSTFQHYILPAGAIGDLPLSDVTLTISQQLCDMIYDAGKTGTVEKVKFALSSMFRRAKAHRLMDHNPATDILLPRNIPHKELVAPTLEEVRRLVAALATPAVSEKYLRHKRSARTSRLDPLHFMRVRVMTLLDWALAMGHAESTGLRVKWVNLTAGVLTHGDRVLPGCSIAVEANHNRGDWKGPKNKSRRRILPLSEGLVEVVRTLMEQTDPGPDDAVFGNGDQPINYSTSLRILKAAGRHAGIPWINWHSLRRFFANISLEFGFPLEVRQYILGHTYAAMTQHYTTVPAIERLRPYVDQITRLILQRDGTATLPIQNEHNE
jgi:integrase